MDALSDAEWTHFERAVAEARAGFAEGGLPIGAALTIEGEVVASGRNRRVQDGSVIRHAEMDCLERAGRRPAGDYARATLHTTHSPCHMCAGAVVLFGIARVVVGMAIAFDEPRSLLERHGVELVIVDDDACRDLITRFIAEFPDVWTEDTGGGPSVVG